MATITPSSPSPLAGEGLGRGGRPSHQLLRERAKEMRSNPTEAERRLWSILRSKRLCGHKFKRQAVIAPYIVDFVSFKGRMIIEADGGHHAEDARDAKRDAFLSRQGFRILRFWNTDILNQTESVGEAILNALEPPLPSAASRLPPSPARGEDKLAGVNS